MKICQYLSWKISFLSFVAIVMVIYIHSYYLEAETLALPSLVQKVGSCVTFPSVPLFYAISGFLFFLGVSHWKQCMPKIQKRIRTLVVPYVISNIIFVLWYVFMAVIPGCSRYVNSDMLGSLSLAKPISTLMFLFVKPAAFQLWFLRDLIVFVAMSPLIFYVIKHTKWYSLILTILLTGWATRLWLSEFVLGGILAVYYSNQIELFRNRYKSIPIISFVVYIIWGILSVMGIFDFSSLSLSNYALQIIVFFPLLAIWGGYDLFVKSTYIPSRYMKMMVGYTFFIFLFHEPFFNIIKKVGLIILGVGEWQLVLLYLINPLILLLVMIPAGILIKRILPGFYKVLVGGR